MANVLLPLLLWNAPARADETDLKDLDCSVVLESILGAGDLISPRPMMVVGHEGDLQKPDLPIIEGRLGQGRKFVSYDHSLRYAWLLEPTGYTLMELPTGTPLTTAYKEDGYHAVAISGSRKYVGLLREVREEWKLQVRFLSNNAVVEEITLGQNDFQNPKILFSGDESQVFVFSNRGPTVRFTLSGNGKMTPHLTSLDPIESLADFELSPLGRTLIRTTTDGKIYATSLLEGGTTRRVFAPELNAPPEERMSGVQFISESRILVGTRAPNGRRTRVGVFDLETGSSQFANVGNSVVSDNHYWENPEKVVEIAPTLTRSAAIPGSGKIVIARYDVPQPIEDDLYERTPVQLDVLWDPKNKDEAFVELRFTELTPEVPMFVFTTALSATTDGKWIVLGDNTGEVRFLDSNTGKIGYRLFPEGDRRDGGINELIMAKDGSAMLIIFQNGKTFLLKGVNDLLTPNTRRRT